MFEDSSLSESPVLSNNTGSQETNQDRLNILKKCKNIRKDKVQNKRNISYDRNSTAKVNITKEHKKEIQKEKNRVAAQLSRDRQKLYVESLESKIADLEKELSSRLCTKCKLTLFENSTSESDNFQIESLNLMEESQNKSLSILNFEEEVSEIHNYPLVRDRSRNDMEWGNIGKYFCLILMVLAVFFVSGSVENTTKPENKLMARILTEQEFCVKESPEPDINTTNEGYNKSNHQFASSEIQVPSTIEQIEREAWPFKQNTGIEIEECKNDFWNNYLQNIRNESSSYDWNLISCTSPNLIHVSNVYENSMNSLGGKWTFLITNPTVSHSHVEKNGNHFIDEVNYLDGIYQMVAENVVLKKVMGEKCLA